MQPIPRGPKLVVDPIVPGPKRKKVKPILKKPVDDTDKPYPMPRIQPNPGMPRAIIAPNPGMGKIVTNPGLPRNAGGIAKGKPGSKYIGIKQTKQVDKIYKTY